MELIRFDGQTHLLVLTGAGISAESGLPTFRDARGLWEQHKVEYVASREGFRNDPAMVWRFYSQRRAAAGPVAPNPGHLALAAIERALGDRFLLATQNVDGLHQRAGSQRMVEMHGNLFTSRCFACDRAPFEDHQLYAADNLPVCTLCAEKGRRALLRPHIVWFGEPLDSRTLDRIDAFMNKAEPHGLVFLAVGTSGVVHPAAALVDVARAHRADTWLVNAEPAENGGRFDHFIQARSAEVLPALLGVAAS